MEIKDYILRKRRNYFIGKVKGPLVSSLARCTAVSKCGKFLTYIHMFLDVYRIVRSVMRYPEPTKENIKESDAHVVLDTFDEFFQYNKCQRINAIAHAVRRIMACEIGHDTEYAQRITWFLKRLAEKYISGEWKPLEPWAPFYEWDESGVQDAAEAEAKKTFSNIVEADSPFSGLMVGMGKELFGE